MSTPWTPMRWPSVWADPATLALLKGTPVNFLLVEGGGKLAAVIAQARQMGLIVSEPGAVPPEVTLLEADWPGVKLTETGAVDQADAGPTGDPWVDSNGWRVRLSRALHPEKQVWINAAPTPPRLFPESYVIALCDAAAAGGRAVIALDDNLAAGIAAGKPESLGAWKRLTGAAAFFAARTAWEIYRPKSVLGIVSDFSGDNKDFSDEVLNLVARTNQQYKVIPNARLSAADALTGLRAVLYAAVDAPPADVKKRLLTFAESGGTLIADATFGAIAGARPSTETHARFDLQTLGKGKIALAKKGGWDDPYLVAQDSCPLVSHRYDLLRFWNGGAIGSYLAATPDGKRALVQLVLYAAARSPTIQVVGRYRSAKLYTLDQPAPRDLEMVALEDVVELHFPPVAQYAAVELEA